MSQVCQFTGKKPAAGNNRSHSMRATKRRFVPNIKKKMIVDPVTGKKVRVKLSTRALRTLAKNPTKFSKELTKLARKKGTTV